MITNMQYALLVGVPTGTIIAGTIVQFIFYRKWMRKFREGTEVSEAQSRVHIEQQNLSAESYRIWREGTILCLQSKL